MTRRAGYPPPEDEAVVGTPLVQWEVELQFGDPEAWREYRNSGCQWGSE